MEETKIREDQIHGSVPKTIAAKFEDYLLENIAVAIRNFAVREKRNKYYCQIPYCYCIEPKEPTDMRLLDVIEIFNKLSNAGNTESGYKKATITIENGRRQALSISFLDDDVIIVIVAIVVQGEQGMLILKILKGKKVYIEPDIPEVAILKKSLQAAPTRKRTMMSAVEPKTILYVKQLMRLQLQGSNIWHAEVIKV